MWSACSPWFNGNSSHGAAESQKSEGGGRGLWLVDGAVIEVPWGMSVVMKGVRSWVGVGLSALGWRGRRLV